MDDVFLSGLGAYRSIYIQDLQTAAFWKSESRTVIPHRAYPYSSLSATMNPANSEAARHKDKKQKRKKHKDAIEDDCGAATAEESAPHEKKKQKQRKDGGEGEEKTKRLKPTVSIAVAGSIIDNAQSLELATMV
jgi:hypothetical protein